MQLGSESAFRPARHVAAQLPLGERCSRVSVLHVGLHALR
jgi:hypothetical protein